MTLSLRPYQAEAVAAALAGPGLSRLVVAPVGAGKSVIAAEIALARLSAGRVVIATHVGELVEQNAAAVVRQRPGLDVGMLAGSLGRHDTSHALIVANIATLHRSVGRVLEHGPVGTLIVDEAHRLDPSGKVYAETLAALRAADPGMLLIGLTGSPWRSGHGNIAAPGRDGQPPIFERMAYAIPHAELVRDGFILPVRTRRTHERLSTAGVAVTHGDFALGELDQAVNRDEVNARAIAELADYGERTGRRRWLLFAVTIDHAERLAAELGKHAVPAGVVSARTPPKARERIVAEFRAGRLRAVVNVAALTTGFDVPEVDLIGLLRPTQSRVLFYQMLGRGTRLADGKGDCVVLDFAGSVLRHGPLELLDWIGADETPNGPRKAKPEDAPRVWTCGECETHNPVAASRCCECDAQRPAPKLDREAGLSAVDLGLGADEPRTLAVASWSARLIVAGGTSNLQLTLRCTDQAEPVSHALWWSQAYPGARERLAREWLRFGGRHPIPRTAEEGLRRFQSGELAMPVEVVAIPKPRNGRTYLNLQSASWTEEAA